MNKFIKFLGISLAIIASIGLVGCATSSNLDKTGVYNGDQYLYNADITIVTTYNVLDSFLKFELANNTYIKTNLPDVFNAANYIRVNAPKAIADINAARSYYIAIKGNTNATLLSFQQASNNLLNSVAELQNQLTNVTIITTNISSITNLQQILTNN